MLRSTRSSRDQTRPTALSIATRTRGPRRTAVWLLALGLVQSAGWAMAARAADEAESLQRSGMADLDRFFEEGHRNIDTTRGMIFSLSEPLLASAASALRRSAELFEQRGDRAGAGLSLVKLGTVYRQAREWDQAADLYRKGYELARQAGSPDTMAKALIGLAMIEERRSNFDAAEAAVDGAARLAAGEADKTDLFDALDERSAIQEQRGDPAAAVITLDRAFTLAPQVSRKISLLHGYVDRAGAYLALVDRCPPGGPFDDCFQGLDRAAAGYREAADYARSQGFEGFARWVENEWLAGYVAEQRSQLERGKQAAKEGDTLAGGEASNRSVRWANPQVLGDVKDDPPSLSKVDPAVDPAGVAWIIAKVAETHELRHAAGLSDRARDAYNNGLSLDFQGKPDEALAAYLRAADLLERERGNLGDEQARAQYLEDKADIYYMATLHYLASGREPEAFALLERSRGRAMADLLVSRQPTLGDARENELYARLVDLRRQIADEQHKLTGAAIAKAAATAGSPQHMAELEDAYRALAAQITAETPKLGQLVVSQPVSLDRLQVLAAEERFDVVQYLVHNGDVLVWHIGPSRSRARSVFLSRELLTAKMKALNDSIRKPPASPNAPFAEDMARQLFLFLVQPVLDDIETDHLVVVPQDILNDLPFQVLEDTDGRFLGERFRLSYVSSATVLAGLAPAGPLGEGRLVAAVNETLPTGPDEVAAIAGLYPGRAEVLISPTAAGLRQHLGSADVVHLAVHGTFHPANPLASGLRLREAEDGTLTAAEMFGLPLGRARLVVLSACESGEAVVTSANETLGITRALLYAGANALVLSRWEVDDASTTAWMAAFHRAARTQPLAEAVREAQAAVRSDPEYRHPFYWAAFQLVGR